MEKITVERDNDRNLVFTGELIAKVSSSYPAATTEQWEAVTAVSEVAGFGYADISTDSVSKCFKSLADPINLMSLPSYI